MPQQHHVNHPFTDDDVTVGLMACVKWGGNSRQASRYLKETGKLEVCASTLRSWMQVHAIRYDELREKYHSEIEATLGHEMRDGAMQAVAAQKLALEKAVAKLEAGKDDDPSKSAANFARVAQSNVDKLMTLTSRPARITESRGIEEILRSLASKGIIAIPAETGDTSDA